MLNTRHFVVAADDDDRDVISPHDLPEHSRPSILGISRSSVTTFRMQFANFFLVPTTSIRGSHDFNGRITLQQLGNQFPHDRGIVHYQHANRFLMSCL